MDSNHRHSDYESDALPTELPLQELHSSSEIAPPRFPENRWIGLTYYSLELNAEVTRVQLLKKWQGRKDSNLHMAGSKPDALPVGYAPTEVETAARTPPLAIMDSGS